MLLLLPPSETKRDGGEDAPLDLDALSHPELTSARRTLVDRVVELSADPDAAMRALKLGPRGAGEVERNRSLRETPTMPALDRYTGVLFDALDAPQLDAASRSFAGETVMIHSALLGLVGALDPIPAYRLSHDSRIPGIRLRAHWRPPLSGMLEERPGLIVDLRSEGYAELGPAPGRLDSVYVRVVSAGSDGRRRALNHFNKQAKGRFSRAFLEQRPEVDSLEEFLDWARGAGFMLDLRPAGAAAAADEPLELELVA